MHWFQLIAGIGLGTLGAKLLDIFWLQKRLNDEQHRAWLKSMRLEAFTEVVKEFMSFGLHDGATRNGFQSYGVVAKALLLLDDNALTKRIDQFIVDMDRMNTLTDSVKSADKDRSEKLYLDLVDEAREITKLLRNIILNDRVKSY